jgi:hypothetical protein
LNVSVLRHEPYPGDTHAYHFDALGSTRLLTDGAEVVTDEYVFDAWGRLTAFTDDDREIRRMSDMIAPPFRRWCGRTRIQRAASPLISPESTFQTGSRIAAGTSSRCGVANTRSLILTATSS